LASAIVAIIAIGGTTRAQTGPVPSYRVFLRTGDALPSHGEPVLVEDRLIFHLQVGTADTVQWTELVTLPADSVDRERTAAYTMAVRAAQYAATRGDAEYAAMTVEVSRALEQLAGVQDAARRLALAREARRRLVQWSDDHYGYRAEDIRQLAGLFDEVIDELRVAAGEPVTFDLVSGVGGGVWVRAPSSPREPLLPPPTLQASIALALAAADAVDVGVERVAVLRAAAATAAVSGAPAEITRMVTARLLRETRISADYDQLARRLLVRAQAARRRGSPSAVEQLQAELVREDQRLGRRRPVEVAAVKIQLSAAAEAAAEVRRALDEYERRRPALQAYARRVRPVLNRLSELESLLDDLREMRTVAPTRAQSGEEALTDLITRLERADPPGALAAVHASLESALLMGREACARRRQMQAGNRLAASRAAAAAAGGALLLSRQARADLAEALRPPAVQ
jgi:hypothetical protein